MLKGIPIILHQKTETGRDAFNRPTYRDETVIVHNCLVAPLSEGDNSITTELNLNGKHGLYQIAIPKGDTHIWEDQTVEFWGHTWKVIGFPTEGIENLIPLSWNKKAVVERYG